MNSEKQFACNKIFICCIISSLFLAICAKDLIIDSTIPRKWGIGFAIASLLFIIIPAIFTPYGYTFDKNGVSLCYIFPPNERYLWKNIHAIEVEYKRSISTSEAAHIFNFFLGFVFSIKGETIGKRRFYMNKNIQKSFRTKYLLEKYWTSLKSKSRRK